MAGGARAGTEAGAAGVDRALDGRAGLRREVEGRASCRWSRPRDRVIISERRGRVDREGRRGWRRLPARRSPGRGRRSCHSARSAAGVAKSPRAGAVRSRSRDRSSTRTSAARLGGRSRTAAAVSFVGPVGTGVDRQRRRHRVDREVAASRRRVARRVDRPHAERVVAVRERRGRLMRRRARAGTEVWRCRASIEHSTVAPPVAVKPNNGVVSFVGPARAGGRSTATAPSCRPRRRESARRVPRRIGRPDPEGVASRRPGPSAVMRVAARATAVGSAPWSIEHSTVAPGSAVNPNVGVVSLVGPAGRRSIDRTAGVSSTEKVACGRRVPGRVGRPDPEGVAPSARRGRRVADASCRARNPACPVSIEHSTVAPASAREVERRRGVAGRARRAAE